MKKFMLIILLCLGCMLVLSGWSCSYVDTENVCADSNNASMFVLVQDAAFNSHYQIVYHETTKVMYAVSDGQQNRGIFTLLVNADGTPMIYEGK